MSSNMSIMKYIDQKGFGLILLAVSLLLVTSCGHGIDKDVATGEDKYDSENFNNFDEINIDITGNGDGHVYSVYFHNPYDETGNLRGEPVLLAHTPIHEVMRLPKGVDTIFVLGDNALQTLKPGNINLGEVYDFSFAPTRAATTRSAATTRAKKGEVREAVQYVSIPQNVLNAINNVCFPESKYNVRGEDLYKCCDLEIREETELWLTYVGNGQPLTNKDYGSIQSRLFIYTYDPAKKDNLTLDDITIYGGKTTNSSYSGLRVVDYASDINGTQNAKNPLFYDRSENQRVSETGLHSKIYLGKFPAGVNVGFLLVADWNRYGQRFSTPSLNHDNHGRKESSCMDPYIGTVLNYDEGDFKITQYVSSAFVQDIPVEDYNGSNCVLLAMDKDYPNFKYGYYCKYDGDYNDMMVFVESSTPINNGNAKVKAPQIKDKLSERGFYIFEDSYPLDGDCDFNDVVVEYSITNIIGTNRKKLKFKLWAMGCDNENEFGVFAGGERIPIFRNIKGYKNVDDNVVKSPIRELELEISQNVHAKDFEPYLDNGSYVIRKKGEGGQDMHDKNHFPFVLDIPMTGQDKHNEDFKFRWCKERCDMRDAYEFDWRDNPNGWYDRVLFDYNVVSFE